MTEYQTAYVPVQWAGDNPDATGQTDVELVAPQAVREIIPGYRLIEQIGQGGYGVVWRAEAPGGLAKAVKVIFGRLGEKQAVAERKALLRIKDVRHPFLLSLERIEVVNNRLVVVTELADSSLQDRFDACVSSGRPGIPRGELLRFLAEAADALDYMSDEYGLQHLDVKPENLLLVGRHVKVADFGLVKTVHQSNSLVGGMTPVFAAPETFDGRPSERSDQYSLAVVYQFLLTGRYPFQGKSIAELAAQHLNARPNVQPLPEMDRAIIERALAKDPFERYANCRALIERLAGSGGGPLPAARSLDPSTDGDDSSTTVEEEIPPKTNTEFVDVEPSMMPSAARAEVVDLPPLELDGNCPQQPTLFIGVGGWGAKALRALSERLSRQWQCDDIPAWRMLLIDTDLESLQLPDASGIVQRDALHVPLGSMQYYRRTADELTRWMSRRWIYNIPKSLKTEGIRPLGRLAMVDHVAEIESKIDQHLKAICDDSAVAQSSAVLGTEVQQRPRVFLVGSISSGTGGGMVWDLAQIVHEVLRQHEDLPAEITLVLGHGSAAAAKEKELATANACAALRELHHYTTEGCPGDAACHLPPLGRHHHLFDKVYLVEPAAHEANLGCTVGADLLADYLHANTLGASAEFASRCRTHRSEEEANDARLRTFSLARVDSSQLVAIHKASSSFIGQFLDDWLHKSADAGLPRDGALASDQRAAHLAGELGITFDALAAHFGELVQQQVQPSRERWRAADLGHEEAISSVIAEIDAELPAQPQWAIPTSDSVSDPLMVATAHFIQQRESDLQERIAQLVGESGLCIDGARFACQTVMADLQQARQLAVETAQEIAGQLESQQVVDAPSLQTYFERKLRASIMGRVCLVSELIRTVVGAMVENVDAFTSSLAAESAQLASARSDAADPDHPEYDHPEDGQPDEEASELFDTQAWQRLQPALTGSVREQLRQMSSDLAKQILAGEGDAGAFVRRLQAAARKGIVEGLLDRQIEAMRPSLLAVGGARRILLIASEEFERARLVELIRQKLPADVTLVRHDRQELILLCEAEGLPIGGVAQYIARQNPHLLEISKQLTTRCDVNWSSW